MKVILIGYMGSGKSVIAKKLSENLKISFVELDNLIEKNQNLSIKDIFSKKGELFFRKLEHQIFNELILNDNDTIISTGGGTPCYFNNHELLNQENCISIYLKASIETLFHRLKKEKEDRPLLFNLTDIELREFIAKHLFERSFYYNQAKFKINVDGKNKEEIILEIQQLLTN